MFTRTGERERERSKNTKIKFIRARMTANARPMDIDQTRPIEKPKHGPTDRPDQKEKQANSNIIPLDKGKRQTSETTDSPIASIQILGSHR